MFKAHPFPSHGFRYRYDMRSITDISAIFSEVDAWCRERFGYPPERWHVSSSVTSITVVFREVNDAFEFRMRWC